MYGTVDRILPRPRWRWLYVLAASMLALLGVADTSAAPGAWRRGLELGTVVIGFGVIHLWVRANRRALDLAGACDPGFRTVVLPPDAEPPRLEPAIEVTVDRLRGL